jgi:hypothetical protein
VLNAAFEKKERQRRKFDVHQESVNLILDFYRGPEDFEAEGNKYPEE